VPNAWLDRMADKKPPSKRELENKAILCAMIGLHNKYPVLDLDSLHQMLKPVFSANRKRIHRLKKRAGIRFCVS